MIDIKFVAKVLPMTKNPETVIEQAPPERGFSLESDYLLETAKDLHEFTTRLYEKNKDVFIQNPSFLGNSHQIINGQERVSFADVRREALEPLEPGDPEVAYEWLLSDGTPSKRVLYIITDGLMMSGAIESKNETGGFKKRLLDTEELAESLQFVDKTLSNIEFDRKADEFRDRREKLNTRLEDFMSNPKLYKRYRDLSRVENKKAFDKLYEIFHELEDAALESKDQPHIPEGDDLTDYYEKQKSKIDQIGFAEATSGRFDEFGKFVTAQVYIEAFQET